MTEHSSIIRSSAEAPRDLFKKRYLQLNHDGSRLLDHSQLATSRAYPELAQVQEELGGVPFELILRKLSHRNSDPQSATEAAKKISDIEVTRGHRNNAIKALDVAVAKAKDIEIDTKCGTGPDMEYPGIAEKYALLGEVQKALDLVKILPPNMRENVHFQIATALAEGGKYKKAFDIVQKSGHVVLLSYGHIARSQAERGDIEAWKDTINRIGDNAGGLSLAYHGLAQYYWRIGDRVQAGQAILHASRLVEKTKGELQVGYFKHYYLNFVLDELGDPEIAMQIVSSMPADQAAIFDSYSKVVDSLIQGDKLKLANQMVTEAAMRLTDLPEKEKKRASFILADMEIKVGKDEEGKKRIENLLIPPYDNLFETVNSLIRYNNLEAALIVIPRTNQLLQLNLLQQLAEKLIGRDNPIDRSRASTILKRSADLVNKIVEELRLKQTGNAKEIEPVGRFLSNQARLLIKLGQKEDAAGFFNIAGELILQIKDDNPLVLESQVYQLAMDEAKAGYFEGIDKITFGTLQPSGLFEVTLQCAEKYIEEGELMKSDNELCRAETIARAIPLSHYNLPRGEPQLRLAAIYYRIAMAKN